MDGVGGSAGGGIGGDGVGSAVLVCDVWSVVYDPVESPEPSGESICVGYHPISK